MDVFRESLNGKVAVISGVGSGQGKAVTEMMLSYGLKVYAFSRSGNKPAIQHERLITLKANSNDVESLSGVRRIIEKEDPIIHILYNNHGKYGPVSDQFDGKVAEEFFRNNVISSINTINTFYPMMKEGGSIVNVGASRSIYKYSSLEYSVSKYSIEELTVKMASMLKKYDIRVNSILPGSVDSSLELSDQIPFKFKELKSKKDVSTLEIAYVALFLISDLSHGITGQSISVDS